jgi:pimeloyl-ACP methyl ester carboxylesterase
MGRSRKIGVAAALALIALLGINALLVGGEAKPAEVTVPGGKILELPGAELQVVDRGPRDGSPIVLVHCFTCAIGWWDGVMPRLARSHRVVAIDLLGHGGSEKPDSGYSVPEQADLVGQALERLRVRRAAVVGHSLGGSVAVALAESAPDLVDRIVVIDEPSTAEEGDLGFVAGLGFAPVVGEALWRIKPDYAIERGLEIAFAPGFDVPEGFVDDVDAMNFSAYDGSAAAFESYLGEEPLDRRIRGTGKPAMVLMGAEEQLVVDPEQALRAYSDTDPGTRTQLIAGAGHSPNVEKPARTAGLILGFAGR